MALHFSPLRGFRSVLVLPALGLAALLPLSAQEPDPNPNLDRAAVAPPPPPADPEAAAPGTGNAPGALPFGNLQNTPVTSVLDIYEGLTGMHLVKDINLNGVPPVSLNGSGLSKKEFIKLIEETLLLDGVAILPIDEKTIKVINVQTKPPGGEGAPLFSNAENLPSTDAIISYYMTLNFISPQEALSVFQGNVPPGSHAYGAYVAAPSAQAVIITENVRVIRKLIQIKELIDVPPAHVATEFVQLNRADAEKVADLLNKMLDQPSTGSTAGGAPPAGGNNAPPPPPPQPDGNGGFIPAGTTAGGGPLQNEKNLLSGTAKIFAVPEKNQIIVITRPINLPFLKQVINQLDQPDTFIVPKRRALKYVLAEDILPAIEIALAVTKDERDQAKSDTSKGSTNGSTTGGGNNNQNRTSSSSSGSSGGGGGVSSITSPLEAPKENNAPTVVTIGKTRLLADNRSNSIIVFGSPDITERVFSMIDELDRRPLQVYLATVIGQLTISNDEEFGVDWLQKYTKYGSSGNATSILNGASTANPVPNGLTAANLFPLVSGLTLYGNIAGTLDYFVRALATTERFKVISRPSVYTTNNKLAVIASGSQVPVPQNITSGFTGSSNSSDGLTTNASITYQNVLLQLDIIPLINADHEVTLKIRQTNDSLGKNNLISGNEVPTIITQEINTEVTVKNHQTVVIGGLISDTTDRTVGGVPYLMDIPVLGYLFSDTKKTKDREELIIMIQPSVVETELEQLKVNETEKQRTILGREAEEAANGGGFSDAPGSFKPKVVTTTTVTTTTTTDKGKGGVYNSKTGSSTQTVTPVLKPIVIPAFGNANPDHPDVTKGHLPPDAPPKTQ